MTKNSLKKKVLRRLAEKIKTGQLTADLKSLQELQQRESLNLKGQALAPSKSLFVKDSSNEFQKLARSGSIQRVDCDDGNFPVLPGHRGCFALVKAAKIGMRFYLIPAVPVWDLLKLRLCWQSNRIAIGGVYEEK